MKLAYIELAGFRGFKNHARLEFGESFTVITGRNGVGKSTTLDALEFVLTGTISKFNVTHARGGGLADHIWWVGSGRPDRRFVRAGFVDEVTRKITEIERTAEAGLVGSLDALREVLCKSGAPKENWAAELVRTSLLRDETLSALSLELTEQARASAVRSALGDLGAPIEPDRIRNLVDAAKRQKDACADRAAKLSEELSRALAQLADARATADRQPDLVRAEAVLTDLVPVGVTPLIERIRRGRALLAQRRATLASAQDAVSRFRRDVVELRSLLEQGDGGAEARLVESMEQTKVLGVRLEELEALERSQVEADRDTSALVSLITAGLSVGLLDGHCPLCDAERSSAEYFGAIERTKKRLDEGAARLVLLRAALGDLRAEYAAHNEAASRAREVAAKRSARIDALQESLGATRNALKAAGIVLEEGELDADKVSSQVLESQSRDAAIEQALYALEASSLSERVSELESKVAGLREHIDAARSAVTRAERALRITKSIESAASEVSNEVVTEQFDSVLPLLKELFERLRPHTDWRDIDIDFGGKVRASLNLTVGNGKNPQFLFSSGQRRAAGLAFLLSLHFSRSWCKLNTLLLDDPIQHIDDYRAINLAEVLSAVRRTGRQVLISVEDGALADLLCRRLRALSSEQGVRYDMTTDPAGSCTVAARLDVSPLPRRALRQVEAS